MGGFWSPGMTNGPVRSGTVNERTGLRPKQTDQSNERNGSEPKTNGAVVNKQSLNGYIMKRTAIEQFERSLNDNIINRTVIDRFLDCS